jgi:cell division protein FtsL
MTRRSVWLLVALVFSVTLSAVSVVYTKYQTRVHFGDLQNLRAQRDALDVEWNRLRLEEAALSTHVRVERRRAISWVCSIRGLVMSC